MPPQSIHVQSYTTAHRPTMCLNTLLTVNVISPSEGWSLIETRFKLFLPR